MTPSRHAESESSPRRFTLAQLRAATGTELAVGPWLELTQARIDAFADATLDPQWIHIDPRRAAAQSPLRDAAGRGRTVAHGFLTLSLLSHFLNTSIAIEGLHAGINAGFDRVRFTAPVPAGSRLRARLALAELRDVAGGAALAWDVTLECDDGGQVFPAAVARWLTRVLVAP